MEHHPSGSFVPSLGGTRVGGQSWSRCITCNPDMWVWAPRTTCMKPMPLLCNTCPIGTRENHVLPLTDPRSDRHAWPHKAENGRCSVYTNRGHNGSVLWIYGIKSHAVFFHVEGWSDRLWKKEERRDQKEKKSQSSSGPSTTINGTLRKVMS